MKRIAFILISLFVFVSCASIVKGNKQLLTINCNVDGAEVLLDGVSVGETPFAQEIEKKGKVILVKKEGYKDYTIALSKNLEPMFWGNIITGGTIGSLTDFGSGAAWAFAPSSYQVELIENGMGLNEFKERTELKKYAMIHMSDISVDLSKGGGEHLETVLSIASLQLSDVNVQRVRTMMIESAGDQVVFGKKIIALLNS